MEGRKPGKAGVEAAAARIAGQVVRTPLLPLAIGGVRLWAKAECLQEGGSFKLRGATNRLMLLSEEERGRGVVAFSSGNHAQGVAIAAHRMGIAATIVMPSDAPAVKRDATLAAGAEIIAYDRATGSREEIGARLAAERGAVLVPSFDDVDVIEGQGSIGVELRAQMLEATGELPDKVLSPCGGGGLSAGIALALPEAEIVTVEPQGWDDMARSFAAGRPVPVPDDAPPTRCDALQTKLVSPLTFGALRHQGARGIAVSEGETEAAMAFAARHLRLVLEPGGAVALAAALAGKSGSLTGRSVIILSGGNVDAAVYAGILEAQARAMRDG
ncbi:MAG TPA: threonine/serine dehydratase [Allosphingosinicella sp.]|nr:threonine/serine dehydratase [Allosphingosinicella sp.]